MPANTENVQSGHNHVIRTNSTREALERVYSLSIDGSRSVCFNLKLSNTIHSTQLTSVQVTLKPETYSVNSVYDALASLARVKIGGGW